TVNNRNGRRGTNPNRNNTRRRGSSPRSRGNPNNIRGEHSTNSLKKNLTEAIQITDGDILSGSQTLGIPAARL
ncbi:MAG TPA: hypothetical protein VF464_09800, partial [Candidatus Methylomirabilis sp.]